MKATGIVRQVDGLGRIVLPKALRDIWDIQTDTQLEVYLEENRIVLRKYVTSCSLCGCYKTRAEFTPYKEALLCDSCLNELHTQ